MQFGTIVDWRVKPGDAVKRGDVVALVETEKGVIEVEIFEEGVVSELVAPVGAKVPVGGLGGSGSGGGRHQPRQAGGARYCVVKDPAGAVCALYQLAPADNRTDGKV